MHRGPRVLGDGGDRPVHRRILGEHDGEPHARLDAGADHRAVAVGGVPAHQDLPGRARRASGGDGLAHIDAAPLPDPARPARSRIPASTGAPSVLRHDDRTNRP